MRLTWRHSEADREPFGIRPGMELGREATARAAETVAMSPPLPPAAWWCARTMVESIICIMLSEASLSTKAARITSQTPASVQRRYCRNTEFQWPSSSGRSRHGEPVRVTQRIASRTLR